MFIFAREWVTWIDQVVVNNSIIRCCISLILVLCTASLQHQTCLSNPKNKQASDRHSPMRGGYHGSV
jgi:hypothetical protein